MGGQIAIRGIDALIAHTIKRPRSTQRDVIIGRQITGGVEGIFDGEITVGDIASPSAEREESLQACARQSCNGSIATGTCRGARPAWF